MTKSVYAHNRKTTQLMIETSEPMMPNINPRDLKNMMDKMGIISSEIEANRVVIECPDKKIVIDAPQIMKIDAQGNTSFQISGTVSEEQNEAPKIEITEEDIDTVSRQSGSDHDIARAALEESNGDIAEAIIKLKKGEHES